MGCPIRRSRDQRLLASPPGLSQRATPFIASQCQGIHQMPLRRSIPDMASAISDKTRHSQGQKPPRKRRFFMKTLYLIRRMNSSQPSAISCQPRTETPASVTLSSPVKEHTSNAGALQANWIFHDRFKRPSLMPPSPLAVTALPLSGTTSLWLVVEVNGIEPMTSCLQSRRSPT